jgi:hypothetical protein
MLGCNKGFKILLAIGAIAASAAADAYVQKIQDDADLENLDLDDIQGQQEQ